MRHLTVVKKETKENNSVWAWGLTLLSPRAPSSLLQNATVPLKNQEMMWFFECGGSSCGNCMRNSKMICQLINENGSWLHLWLANIQGLAERTRKAFCSLKCAVSVYVRLVPILACCSLCFICYDPCMKLWSVRGRYKSMCSVDTWKTFRSHSGASVYPLAEYTEYWSFNTWVTGDCNNLSIYLWIYKYAATHK